MEQKIKKSIGNVKIHGVQVGESKVIFILNDLIVEKENVEFSMILISPDDLPISRNDNLKKRKNE
jgi:hypothetical protein